MYSIDTIYISDFILYCTLYSFNRFDITFHLYIIANSDGDFPFSAIFMNTAPDFIKRN